MRDDMSELIIERPRHGSRRRYRHELSSAQAALDCFAEPVIGPRDFARVRWLAMTILGSEKIGFIAFRTS